MRREYVMKVKAIDGFVLGVRHDYQMLALDAFREMYVLMNEVEIDSKKLKVLEDMYEEIVIGEWHTSKSAERAQIPTLDGKGTFKNLNY